MTTILSQKVNKDGVEQIYDCSITEYDTVVYSNNTDSLEIDFPTLKEFMNQIGNNYENEYYSIKDGFDTFRFFSKSGDNKVILPKVYFLESYQILENLWEEDLSEY